MRFLPVFAFVCATALSAFGQTSYLTPAPANSPEVAESGSLDVARNGNEVLLTWTLPEGEIRLLEIYRNVHRETNGRGRVAGLRATVNIYHDTVPDLDVTYWYWIKITRPDGRIVNVGPIPTPAPSVWTP